MVGSIVQNSLEVEGYDVIAAHDGQTALALVSLEARPSPITGNLGHGNARCAWH